MKVDQGSRSLAFLVFEAVTHSNCREAWIIGKYIQNIARILYTFSKAFLLDCFFFLHNDCSHIIRDASMALEKILHRAPFIMIYIFNRLRFRIKGIIVKMIQTPWLIHEYLMYFVIGRRLVSTIHWNRTLVQFGLHKLCLYRLQKNTHAQDSAHMWGHNRLTKQRIIPSDLGDNLISNYSIEIYTNGLPLKVFCPNHPETINWYWCHIARISAK